MATRVYVWTLAQFIIFCLVALFHIYRLFECFMEKHYTLKGLVKHGYCQFGWSALFYLSASIGSLVELSTYIDRLKLYNNVDVASINQCLDA